MRRNSIIQAESRPDEPSGAPIIRLAAFTIFVAIFSPIPSNAYSTYSLASLESNGTVVGTAVTDGTPPPGTNMNHTAYATATLTSPKGRKATGSMQGTNTTHAEALLSFDPTDTGDYLEASTHTVYCPCMGYFIHNAPSQASVPVPTFNVAYSSYIPVDHVSGPTGCSVGLHSVLSMIYMGDALRNTYRTTESIQITPDGQNSSGFYQNTGNTRNYGYGSPANGSTLSQADEDGVALDCYLWNNAGQAIPAFSYDVSYPYSFQGQVHYSGAASNPLESLSPPITWDMRTVVDETNPSAPTAYVNYNHTCYPAHQIKVNGTVVYSYTPPENDLAYIAACLSQLNAKITGQTSSVQVPPQ